MKFVNGIPVDGHQLVESVYGWNLLAQQGLPSQPGGHFEPNRVGFNIGMQLEEISETITAVALGAVDPHHREQMAIFISILKAWGREFKEGKHYGSVLRGDREEMLDGAIDVAFVAINTLLYQTPHWREALTAVLTANAKKFPGGVVKRDENGKIVKPDGWVKADLTPYIDHTGE